MAEQEKPSDKVAGKDAHARLETVALHIFNRLGEGAPVGRDISGLARESFVRAKAFLLISEGVKSGEISAEPPKPEPTEYIEVPVWQQQSDEKWRPVVDPVTNKPVTQRAPIDRYAYAPNLAADHPINQRFKPVDGVSFEDRKRAFNESRELANSLN